MRGFICAIWQRDIATVERIKADLQQSEIRSCDGDEDEDGWADLPLANWLWHSSDRMANKRGEEFEVVQITKADYLVAEIWVMHHCI